MADTASYCAETLFAKHLGPDWSDWIRSSLLLYLGRISLKLHRNYSREELHSHAMRVCCEMILGQSKSTREALMRDVSEVRAYISRMACHALTAAAREEDNPTCVHAPRKSDVRSEYGKAARDRAMSQAVSSFSSSEGEEEGALFESLRIEDVDPHFLPASTECSRDPADLIEVRQISESWGSEIRDFIDALHEIHEEVMAMPSREAKTARYLIDGRPNSAYLLLKALHEADPSKTARLAPAMCLRWIYNIDRRLDIEAVIAPLTANRSIDDVFEYEARSLVAWVRSYRRIVDHFGGMALERIVSDARASTKGWRDARSPAPAASAQTQESLDLQMAA